MGGSTSHRKTWALSRRQHRVVSREQLLALGFTRHAIEHRVDKGRLFLVYRGVYAVGHPDLTPQGQWMAAVLAGGDGAALSHASAAALWGIRPLLPDEPIHISITTADKRAHGNLVIHRRKALHRTRRDGIPVTTPTDTLIDLAAGAIERQIEADINEAAVLGIATPAQVHRAAKRAGRRSGAAAVRKLLDRQTLLLTDTELERLFLRVTRRICLPDPKTQARVNGHRVDFWWPDLNLVIETDGGNFHKTPAQQTRDRERDQAHFAAGLTPLRFTHAQVRYDPPHVESVLLAVVLQRPH